VDGLSFSGVMFAFTVNGISSGDAHYNAIGPGVLTYVQDPSLEGDSSGVLTLTFDVPTPVIQFGVALSTVGTLTSGFSVELFGPGMTSLGVFDVPTESLFTLTEGQFTYDSALVLGIGRRSGSPGSANTSPTGLRKPPSVQIR